MQPENIPTPAITNKKICRLPMEEGYELSREQLKTHAPYKVKVKDWHWPIMDFIGYDNNELVLKISSEAQSFILTLNFCEDHMDVSCNCETAEEGRLCLHAYKLLQRIVLYRFRFFTKFRPGGEVDLALKHKRYFNVQWDYDDLRIRKKNFTGKLYAPCKEASLSQLQHALQKTGNEKKQGKPTDLVVCYFLLKMWGNPMLPFVVPCLGTFNKAGTDIKGFHHYLSSLQKQYDHLHSEEQRVLNLICLDLYKLTEALPGSLIENDEPMDEEKLKEWIKLWKQAIRFLQNQSYVFYCPLWNKRDLKGKPAKRHARAIKLCTEEPLIGFTLTEKEEISQLQLTARKQQGRLFQNFETDLPFFIRTDDVYYFLSSPKDAAVAEWMDEEGPITVFKEHYSQFEQEILQPLQQHYPIEIIKK